jgi:hypothetical protein
MPCKLQNACEGDESHHELRLKITTGCCHDSGSAVIVSTRTVMWKHASKRAEVMVCLRLGITSLIRGYNIVCTVHKKNIICIVMIHGLHYVLCTSTTVHMKKLDNEHPAWIEKLIENRSVFMKTRETGPDRFHQFLVNQPVNLKILFFEKKLK